MFKDEILDCQQLNRSAGVIMWHHQGSFEFLIILESHQTHFMSWSEVHVLRTGRGQTWTAEAKYVCGPARGYSWLMCSLAPINQPWALTINPGWLLIGTEGNTGRPITGSLPEPPQLQQAYLWPCLCTVIGQLESIRMKGIGGLITDLSRLYTLIYSTVYWVHCRVIY